MRIVESARRGAVELIGHLLRGAPVPRGRLRLERLARRIGRGLTYRRRVSESVVLDLHLEDTLQSVLFFEGSYEPAVLNWLKRLLRPGDKMVDVGANIGLHTLHAAALVGDAGCVEALEPEPACREALEHHVALNGVKNVRVFDYGLASEHGEGVLFVSSSENRGKNSLSRRNADLAMRQPSRGAVTIDLWTLDEHVEANRPPPQLLKVDVEGAELLVFRGGARTLGAADSPAILFEASELLTGDFGYSTRDLKAFLSECGYRIFRAEAPGLSEVAPDESHRLEDLVALKAKHLAMLDAS